MEAAPSTKPRREPPPLPPNYVSLKQLRELRLKEKEEEEKRRREEEEEAAAAAAKRAAAIKAEEAAFKAAAVKREAVLKAGTKGRADAVSREGFGGAKERHHREGQGKQWVAVAQRAPATTPPPTPTCGEVAAREKEWSIGGNRGKMGPEDVADNAPHAHGGCKSSWKGKNKKKASSRRTVGGPGNLDEAAAPAASNGGKPEDKSEIEIKAMGNASVAPLDPAKAAVGSSPGQLTCKGSKGAGCRSAETSPGDAPAKTAGPSPPRGVKSGKKGEPQPGAPRLADAAGSGGDSPRGKEEAPVQAPPTSVADKQKTVEAKPEGRPVEGQHRQPAWVARRSAEPRRRRGNGDAEPHGCAWVPKAKAAAAVGSSAGAGDK